MTVCTKLLVSMGGVTLHRRGGHAFAGQHQGARILITKVLEAYFGETPSRL